MQTYALKDSSPASIQPASSLRLRYIIQVSPSPEQTVAPGTFKSHPSLQPLPAAPTYLAANHAAEGPPMRRVSTPEDAHQFVSFDTAIQRLKAVEPYLPPDWGRLDLVVAHAAS